jgi:hypothetical protein
VVALSELHQGVLSDLLTEELGWGWDGRARRHSEQLRFEVTGVPEALMAEFSQRSAAIEERKTVLINQFVAAHGRQPTSVEVLELRRRATLETRPAKEHHSLAEMTGVAGAGRALHRRRPGSWVAGLADRNDLPLLRAGDLADEILGRRGRRGGAAVAERRATFSRANVLAEVHRQFHGVRFASPDDRIAVAERTADLARVSPCSSRRPSCTTRPSASAGPMGRAGSGPRVTRSTPPPPSWRPRPACSRPGDRWTARPSPRARWRPSPRPTCPAGTTELSLDQAVAVGADRHLRAPARRAGRPAGTGKSTTMAGLRAAWEAEHGAGSVLGLAPSAAAAEVLADELGDRHREHGQVALRAPPRDRAAGKISGPRATLGSFPNVATRPDAVARRIAAAEAKRWPAGASGRASW